MKTDDDEDERGSAMNMNLILLENILDVIPHCLIAINKAGQVTYVNRQYCSLLGLKKSEIYGRPVREVISPDSQLPNVARGAPPTHNKTLLVHGHQMVVNQVPIRYGDEIIGAAGIALFTEAEQILSLARSLFSINLGSSNMPSHNWMARYTSNDILGSSPPMVELRKGIQCAAQTLATVLILGESGTGKELVAHSIHAASSRSVRPFVNVNCSAIPHSLLESELFGYEGGAFTGARPKGQPGKFELANGGTIFLDEIGDMPMDMQSALLRVLQEREIVRIGGSRPIPIDVRVICATHRDLQQRVRDGQFRLDLFYRLDVFQLSVPALREHPQDIPDLVDHMLTELTRRNNLRPTRVEPAVFERLKSHDWPGNVRELHNAIEYAVTVLDGEVLECRHLPALYRKPPAVASVGTSLQASITGTERALLIEALANAKGNKSRAARILKIDRTSLYKKLRRYDLM